MNNLSVFSGDCLMAVCGRETGFKDWRGDPLRTGDIVLTFTVSGEGDDIEYGPENLTAVVSDEWTTSWNGIDRTHVRNTSAPKFFVMGIKHVPLDSPGRWRVMRVKRFEEVIAGERWKAYGFSYAPTPTEAQS